MELKDIQTRLRETIKSSGIPQKEIAKKIGIARITYSHYEVQEKIIPLERLNTICNYFNVSIDYIFDFKKDKAYKDSSKEINSKIISERLRKFRKDNKLTQDKLAKILNVSRTTITEYERGTNLIATPFLYTICKNYDISADYLLGKIDYQVSFK